MDLKKLEESLHKLPEISHEEWLRHTVMTGILAKRVILPPTWKEVNAFPNGSLLHGIKCFQRSDGLNVLFSYVEFDEKPWLHVSLSRRKKIPYYEDLLSVKRIFVGDDRQAIQVFPKAEKHINLNEYVLHLWCGLEGDGLPDFGRYGVI